MQRIRWPSATFASVAVAWAAALPASAWCVTPGSAGPLRMAAAFIYAAGAVVCHQKAERSFHLSGVPLPVCARCTGIYLAAAGVAAVAIVLTRLRRAASVTRQTGTEIGRPLAGSRSIRRLAICAVLPSLLTLVWEWTFSAPSNAVRAAAGMPIGAFVSWLMMRHADHVDRERGRVWQSE